MRHDTEKQIAATIKAFKPIEAYLQQKKKLADAFTALEAKVAKTEEDHKAFMQKAGAREAQRLLGEGNDADASSLDAGMLEIRDQRDRLEAARQALSLQQDALSRQSADLLNQASQALSALAGIVEADLNEELRQAALQVSSIVNKLYAFSTATHFGRTNNGIMEIEIPSIVDGSNLFKRPARYHPLQNTLLDANWEKDAEAKALHDKLACGSAGLLVKLQLVSKELDPLNKMPLKLTGQELQAESYAVANMNGIIHDMDIEIARGDTMINPKFRNADGKIKTFDIVVANPMWNQPFNPDIFANDPFDRFRTAGGVSTGKGDWAWLQHTLACLNDKGRAAVVLDTGAVTRGSGSKNDDKERSIRKWFVDRDLIDGIILLPDNLFYNTTAAGIVVVLNKRKPAARKDKIVLFNASKHLKKGKPKNYIPEDDIRPLASSYLKGEPIDGEIAIITRQQAEEADYNLSPSRWVGAIVDNNKQDITQLIEKFEAAQKEEASLSAILQSVLRKLKAIA